MRARKTTNIINQYWLPTHDISVRKWHEARTIEEKNKIYTQELHYAISEMVDILLKMYCPSQKENFDELKQDTISHIHEYLLPKITDYSKSYSFISVCTTRYLFQKNIKHNKNKNKHCLLIFDDDEDKRKSTENYDIISSKQHVYHEDHNLFLQEHPEVLTIEDPNEYVLIYVDKMLEKIKRDRGYYHRLKSIIKCVRVKLKLIKNTLSKSNRKLHRSSLDTIAAIVNFNKKHNYSI